MEKKGQNNRLKYGMQRVDKAMFNLDPSRYEFRNEDPAAPACPYGHPFLWVGYDNVNKTYVRFTKSIVKDARLQKMYL